MILEAKQYIDQGDYPKALEILMEILDKNPDDPMGLFLFGLIAVKQNKRGLAYNLYRRCAALQPDNPSVWINFGRCMEDSPEGWEEALNCFKRALEIDPQNVAAMSNIATIYTQSCQPKEAKIWAKRALKLDPEWEAAKRALSFAYLMLGDWGKGWKLYESMMGTDHRIDVHYNNLPLWEGQPGETVIVYGEQGIGDEVLYSSVLEDMAKDCTVIYDTMPRLEGLLKRSLSDVHVIGARWSNELVIPEGLTPTCRIPLAGVPVYYRKKESDFTGKPYLKADPAMRHAMRGLLDSLGPKPKIGIAWTGGSKNTRHHFRTFGLEELLEIIRVPEAEFVSLQYKDPSEEIEKLKEKRGITINHFPWITEIKDYDLTAALVSELDLVISVPTSVTQLAGGLGVEGWVLVPDVTGWLFMRDTYPWAKSLRLFHDWTPKQIADELQAKLKAKEAA